MSAKDVEKQIVSDWNNNIKTPVTNYLNQIGIKGVAEHIGNKQYSPTSEWKVYNKQKSYAKTDIKIGEYKISLKSMSDHVLMSAKQGESIATFMCVADKLYGNKIPDIINEIVKEMSGMVTTASSPVKIAQAKREGNEVIKNAEGKHASIIEKINELFDNPVFIVSVVKEILTGELKFGKNSDGCATHILYITHKPILYSLNDQKHLQDLAGEINFTMDWKSVKKTQGSDYGAYRFWSVLQIINKSLIQGNDMFESSFFSKAYSYALSVFADIKQQIINWNDIFSFLEIQPEITIKSK